MSYLDWLRYGSEFHKVELIKGGFTIRAADPESAECRRQFHGIVERAISQSSVEGYEVINLHRTSQSADNTYDHAVIVTDRYKDEKNRPA